MAFYMEKPKIIWAPSGKDVSNRLLLSHDTDLGGSYPAQPPHEPCVQAVPSPGGILRITLDQSHNLFQWRDG